MESIHIAVFLFSTVFATTCYIFTKLKKDDVDLQSLPLIKTDKKEKKKAKKPANEKKHKKSNDKLSDNEIQPTLCARKSIELQETPLIISDSIIHEPHPNEQPKKPILKNRNSKDNIVSDNCKEFEHTIQPKDELVIFHEKFGQKASVDVVADENFSPWSDDYHDKMNNVKKGKPSPVKENKTFNTSFDEKLDNEKINKLNQDIEALKSDKNKLSKAVKDAEKRTQKYEAEVVTLKDEISKSEASIASIKNELESKNRMIKDLEKNAELFNMRLNNLSKEKSKLENEFARRSNEIKAERESFKMTFNQTKNENQMMKMSLNKIQEENTSLIQKFQEEIHKVKQTAYCEIEGSKNASIANLNQTIMMLETKNRELNDSLTKSEMKLNDYANMNNNLKNSFDILKRQVETLQNEITKRDSNQTSNLEKLHEQTVQDKNTINKLCEEISDLKKELDIAKKVVENANYEKSRLSETNQKLRKEITKHLEESKKSSDEINTIRLSMKASKETTEKSVEKVLVDLKERERVNSELKAVIKALNEQVEHLKADLAKTTLPLPAQSADDKFKEMYEKEKSANELLKRENSKFQETLGMTQKILDDLNATAELEETKRQTILRIKDNKISSLASEIDTLQRKIGQMEESRNGQKSMNAPRNSVNVSLQQKKKLTTSPLLNESIEPVAELVKEEVEHALSNGQMNGQETEKKLPNDHMKDKSEKKVKDSLNGRPSISTKTALNKEEATLSPKERSKPTAVVEEVVAKKASTSEAESKPKKEKTTEKSKPTTVVEEVVAKKASTSEAESKPKKEKTAEKSKPTTVVEEVVAKKASTSEAESKPKKEKTTEKSKPTAVVEEVMAKKASTSEAESKPKKEKTTEKSKPTTVVEEVVAKKASTSEAESKPKKEKAAVISASEQMSASSPQVNGDDSSTKTKGEGKKSLPKTMKPPNVEEIVVKTMPMNGSDMHEMTPSTNGYESSNSNQGLTEAEIAKKKSKNRNTLRNKEKRKKAKEALEA